jgi:hypothetical protein
LSFGSIQTSEENVSGVAHYVYTYGGVGDATVATVNYVAGTEYPIVEVSFADNPPLDQIKLVQLPGGGTTQNSNFYMALGGVEVENSTAQFYGSNAVNDGNGFDGTSFVTIGGTLPVKFISFYALKSGDAAKLTWTVNDDPENKYFDVERSLEGRDYKAFTRVNALANGAATNTYNTMDPVLSKQGSKTLYYRVKQVDRNGTTTYSLVRMLNVDNGTAISLYPNPARTTTKMIVDAPEAGQASVILRDGAGKQLQMINWQLVKGINQKDINVGSLPSGEYHVTLMGAGMNQTIKLSKVN